MLGLVVLFVEDRIQTHHFRTVCRVLLLCGGILSQITAEGYQKLASTNFVESAVRGGLPMLLGLISRDKNGVEDGTFTLSGGPIDDFSINNEGT